MTRIFLSIYAILLAAASLLNGQQADVDVVADLPVGPLLKSAPDFSQWTVKYEYPKATDPKDQAQNGAETIQVSIVKTGNIVSEEIVDRRGGHESIWHVGGTQYRKPAGQGDWFESVASVGGNIGNSDFSPLPANGYRGWDWIGPDSYAGTIALDTGACFVFVPGGAQKLKASGGAPTKDQIAAQPLIAFVNVETRLPVALRVGGITQRFVFAAPPTAIQQFPSDLADAIKKGEEARRRLFQPAPRPF